MLKDKTFARLKISIKGKICECELEYKLLFHLTDCEVIILFCDFINVPNIKFCLKIYQNLSIIAFADDKELS